MKLGLYTLRVFFLVAIFAFNPLYGAKGQSSKPSLQQVSPSSSSQTQLQFEREKFERTLEIEQAKLELEERKAWISALTTTVPLVAGFMSISFGAWSIYQQAKLQRETRKEQSQLQLELKIAEIVLNSKNPVEVRNRARTMKALIGRHFPKDFEELITSFNPEEYTGGGESASVKIDFWKTLVEHSGSEHQALELWRHLFPKDPWIERVEIALSKVYNQVPPEK